MPFGRSRRRPLCGAPVKGAGGETCRNYAATCPHPSHRLWRESASRNTADYKPKPDGGRCLTVGKRVIPRDQPLQENSPPLSANSGLYEELVDSAVDHYGLAETQIRRDYQMIRALYLLTRLHGEDAILARGYHPPGNPSAVGTMVLVGGTSLSAAWDITSRHSEDIDMVISPTVERQKPRHVKAAHGETARAIAGRFGVRCDLTDRSQSHAFYKIGPVSVDFTIRDLNVYPLYIQKRPVVSLIGRMEPGLVEEFPELGGFQIPALGPSSTAMDKWLAQARLSLTGNLRGLRGRARDIYDMAMIARHVDEFEGQFTRDGPGVLHLAEKNQMRANAPGRPDDGFGSLASLQPGTPENGALAEGYAAVMSDYVWGEKLSLPEAVEAALTLDPGPSSPPDGEPRPGSFMCPWYSYQIGDVRDDWAADMPQQG